MAAVSPRAWRNWSPCPADHYFRCPPRKRNAARKLEIISANPVGARDPSMIRAGEDRGRSAIGPPNAAFPTNSPWNIPDEIEKLRKTLPRGAAHFSLDSRGVMENCGLVLAIPVTFLASLVFCLLAYFAFRRWPRVQHICMLIALLVVGALLVEVVLSFRVGPFHLYERFGRSYWALHMVGFFLGPPAVAVVVFVAISRFVRFVLVRVGLAAAVCWFACMATLLGNIMVDEDISGIDGSGQRPTDSLFPP